MRMLILTPEHQDKIREAVAFARVNPVPWSVLKKSIPDNQDTFTLTLADRNSAAEPRKPYVIELPLGYRLNVTCEEQPAGMCLHLSMSTPTPEKTLPSPTAIDLILQLLGLENITQRRAWVEEFMIDGKRGGKAINVIVLLAPTKEGHA